MRSLLLALLALSAITTHLHAETLPRLNAVDFFLDWEQYVGKVVIVSGGTVVVAQADKVMVYSLPGNFYAHGPWADKDDLRFLLNNCTGMLPSQKCTTEMAGTVQKSRYGNGPELIGTDFAVHQ